MHAQNNLLYARGIEHVYPQYKVKRLNLEQLALPNPRTFELNGGKFESAGSSRTEGLDRNAVDGMIEIARKIADLMFALENNNL